MKWNGDERRLSTEEERARYAQEHKNGNGNGKWAMPVVLLLAGLVVGSATYNFARLERGLDGTRSEVQALKDGAHETRRDIAELKTHASDQKSLSQRNNELLEAIAADLAEKRETPKPKPRPKPKHKVICHIAPPEGKSESARWTLTLPPEEADRHLNEHDVDYLGACD